jgi:oligopeptide/dipeptide ABC transporter ATP-binding protein
VVAVTELTPLLELRDLRVVFATEAGPARAVDGVSFAIAPGETLGLVGESGCGKTVTALSILRLVGDAGGRIAGGEVRFRGRSLLGLAEPELRAVRGREIGIVFQDPTAALNPVFTCGDQVAEMFRVHLRCGRREARDRGLEMLRRVHLPDPERVARAYPHELSGGMCQRVMIAIALACGPSLLVADEPTTALDVTIQAQICELLLEMQAETGMALLLITHDLGLVAGLADRIALMYAGRIVEQGPVAQVLASPRHPYTLGLLRSLPSLEDPPGRLQAIPGTVPHPARLPSYCRFHDRCDFRVERCHLDDPALREVGAGHSIACFVDVGEAP